MSRPCAICGKPRVKEFRAFCSATCRDKDLLAWGNDAYILPEDPGLSTEDVFSADLTEKTLDS